MFFAPNAGADKDGGHTIDLLIYYTLGNEGEVTAFDFLTFGSNPCDSVEDDVTNAIIEHEHNETFFAGRKRVNVFNKHVRHLKFNPLYI